MTKYGILGSLALLLSACSAPQPCLQPPPEPSQWLAVDLDVRDTDGKPLPLSRQAELQATLRSILESRFDSPAIRQVTLVVDGTSLHDRDQRSVQLSGSCSLFRGKVPEEIPSAPLPAAWKGWIHATQPIGLYGDLSGEFLLFDADGNCHRSVVSPAGFRIEIGADHRLPLSALNPPDGVEFRCYVGGITTIPDQAPGVLELSCDKIEITRQDDL